MPLWCFTRLLYILFEAIMLGTKSCYSVISQVGLCEMGILCSKPSFFVDFSSVDVLHLVF